MVIDWEHEQILVLRFPPQLDSWMEDEKVIGAVDTC
jgi:hypothetical protein